jgi:hypothetical protein
MHSSHLLGAGAVLAACGWFLTAGNGTPPQDPPPPTPPPPAVGHYVLVVEGNRNELAVTAASHKPDPWAGVPKGTTSTWRLRIADAAGATLADVPLDVAAFDTDEGAPLRAVTVQGCVVRSPAIGMLVNVPAFPTAASYTFSRPGARDERVVLGAVPAERVRELTGGGR